MIKTLKLDGDTVITMTIGVLWSVIIGCVGAAAAGVTMWYTVLNKLEKIETAGVDHYEASAWVESFRDANPTVKVPPFPNNHIPKNAAVNALPRDVIVSRRSL